MFDHPTDPKHLIDSLIAFVDTWLGIRPWYGVAPEKLSACPLPTPLAILYASLGNMPGVEGSPFAFSRQDTLLPFEWLRSDKERLLFAVENQGCWRAYTELTGDDPPVWFVADEEEPELDHPSLANFLVTLCLQEITLSSCVTYAAEGLIDCMKASNCRVAPLWMDGLFPGYDRLRKATFHLVDGNAIIYGDHWIGLRSTEDEVRFQAELRGATRIHPPKTLGIADFLADQEANPIAKRLYYERMALEHQSQADLQQARADECRRLASIVMDTNTTDQSDAR